MTQSEKQKADRRRGDVLDDAILAAAWAELLENGYSTFTLEVVAKRAGTSRPVLSRRWQGRTDLAVAAMEFYFRSHPLRVPDLGNVHDELELLLHKASDRSMIVITQVMVGMREYFGEAQSDPAELRKQVVKSNVLQVILERGVRRGELDPARLTKRIASLPVDLLRHEIIMTQKPVSKAAITEIVEQIFLPLVKRQ